MSGRLQFVSRAVRAIDATVKIVARFNDGLFYTTVLLARCYHGHY